MARRSRVTAKAEPAPEPAPVAIAPPPSAVKARWYPATIQIPGEPVPHRKAKVYACPEGLYVYYAIPSGNSIAPDWYSPIDFSATVKPPTGYRARNGFPIITEAGTVMITLGNGCGCGWPLKKWKPQFEQRVVAW